MTTLLVTLCLSQIAIKDQPGTKLLDTVVALQKAKLIPQKELLAQKQEPIPADAAQALLASDWLAFGGYMYKDKMFSLHYGEDSGQWHIKRYMHDGSELNFSTASVSNGGPKVVHTNFQNPPLSKEAIVLKNGTAWLANTSYGEVAYSRILRFRDGVMVVDITKSGKMTDKKVMFRSVLAAMPAQFAWQFGE